MTQRFSLRVSGTQHQGVFIPSPEGDYLRIDVGEVIELSAGSKAAFQDLGAQLLTVERWLDTEDSQGDAHG